MKDEEKTREQLIEELNSLRIRLAKMEEEAANTEQKKVEENIKASLEEKEVMLREIHHRVKNNMQIITSLLRLQAANTSDETTQEMFRESQNRIRSMALIHESLYKAKDLSRIDFPSYLGRMTVHLASNYRIRPNMIEIELDIQKVYLDINQAIPVGLIVNELLSNSFKHAFLEGRKGRVLVRMRPQEEGRFELVVQDNGVGFPEEVDFRSAESLGLLLVRDLVKQIEGTITLDTSEGTTFTIQF